MRAMILTCFLVIYMASAPQMAYSQEDSLRRRFLAEYPGVIKAWEAKCARVEGTVRYEGTRLVKGEKIHRDTMYSFKCNFPDLALLTTTTRDANGYDQEVDCFNKDYFFSLMRRDETQEYSIISISEMSNKNHVPDNFPTNVWLRAFLLVPYSSLGIDNRKLVDNPNMSIYKISPLTHNGKNLLKVEFELASKGNRVASPKKGLRQTGGHEGFLVVSPDEKWAIYEYGYREKTGGRLYKRAVHYKGVIDGFPIPEHVSGETLKLPEGEVVNSYAYHFVDLKFDSSHPKNDFTLSAFGIPESVLRPSNVARASRLGYWILGLAFTSLIAAITFKILASRHERASRP